MAHDIFISYEHHDKAVADAVCATLEAHHLRCWIAPRDVSPGKTWAEEIYDAISHSKLLILIFSTNSNVAEQVLREVNLAADARLPILPFRIEDVTPGPALRFYVGTQHWLDALTPPMQRHIDELAASAAAFVQRGASAEEDGTQALAGGSDKAATLPRPRPSEPGGRRWAARLPPWVTAVGGLVALVVVVFALLAVRALLQSPQELVVVKQYGAALHKDADSNANILTVAPCNAHLVALSGPTPAQWYEVTWQGVRGWVGIVRVRPARSNTAPDCTGAATFQPGALVVPVGTHCMTTTTLPTPMQADGCRGDHCAAATATPAVGPDGPCIDVPDGTRSTVLNGPIDPGDNVDQIEVRNPLGDGWLPAKFLAPSD